MQSQLQLLSHTVFAPKCVSSLKSCAGKFRSLGCGISQPILHHDYVIIINTTLLLHLKKKVLSTIVLDLIDSFPSFQSTNYNTEWVKKKSQQD